MRGFGGQGGVSFDIFGNFGKRQFHERGDDLVASVDLDFMESVHGCKKSISYRALLTCSNCSGTGARPGTKPEKCSPCRGTGQQMMSSGFMNVISTCSRCGGTGEVVKDPCTTCKGRGLKPESTTVEVDIPAGVESGLQLQIRNRGHAGPSSAPRGNLILQLNVKESETFKRIGNNVHVDVDISLSQACLGGVARVPSLYGDVELKEHNLAIE
ncbi:chaperone protein DnaJ-like [Zophobas morio]|uniref:chaperone protein DnaJ-like n=1 Tax=Zophobas morio TaxID=2755281 RepID=UPI003083D027